jgi:hypothetical protein
MARDKKIDDQYAHERRGGQYVGLKREIIGR